MTKSIHIDYQHFGSIPDDAQLDSCSTYMPVAQSPQEQVMQAYCQTLEDRIARLYRLILAAQLSCNMGDSRTAAAVLSQALTSI
jgi:hypothetical protein